MDPTHGKFACGAECGIAVAGTASAGTEHWSSVTGTPTLVTSGPTPMRSARCFRFNQAGSNAFLQHTFTTAIASPSTTVGRFYVYFTTLPNSDVDIYEGNGGATGAAAVRFVSSDSTLRARAIGTNAASGFVVTTGVWYRVDFKHVFNTTTTCDLAVNGTALAQASAAGSADTCVGMRFGPASATTTDMYIDDMLMSGTSADYPIGVGTIVGIYPNGDSTNSSTNPSDNQIGHFYSAVGDFGKGAGGATNLAAQQTESTSWQSLQNPLSTTIPTNFIADLLGASTEHLVWNLDDMPAAATGGTVNGVMGVCTSHSASTTANNCFVEVQSAATLNDRQTIVNADLSEATITVPCAMILLYSNGLAIPWSVANVGFSAIRFSSSDVNPDVFLDGVCLEVDYTPPPVVGELVQVSQAVQRASVR